MTDHKAELKYLYQTSVSQLIATSRKIRELQKEDITLSEFRQAIRLGLVYIPISDVARRANASPSSVFNWADGTQEASPLALNPYLGALSDLIEQKRRSHIQLRGFLRSVGSNTSWKEPT
jgi:hypothetical protein